MNFDHASTFTMESKADCRWFLKDRGDFASENFVSEQDSRFYADMYRKSGIKGGLSFCSILWTASIMRIQRSRLLWRLKRIRRAYR